MPTVTTSGPQKVVFIAREMVSVWMFNCNGIFGTYNQVVFIDGGLCIQVVLRQVSLYKAIDIQVDGAK